MSRDVGTPPCARLDNGVSENAPLGHGDYANDRTSVHAHHAASPSLPGAPGRILRRAQKESRQTAYLHGEMLLSKGVKLTRWPIEADVRNDCRRAGIPRLLVVEAGKDAPVCADPTEDWIRAPASRGDVEARIQALVQRAYGQKVPSVDSTGVLCFGMNSVAISSTQVGIMELFVAHYGEVVYRAELVQQVVKATGKISRNALDLQIMRLRRRIVAVGLSIRTVWGRGYILEAATA